MAPKKEDNMVRGPPVQPEQINLFPLRLYTKGGVYLDFKK